MMMMIHNLTRANFIYRTVTTTAKLIADLKTKTKLVANPKMSGGRVTRSEAR